MNGAWYGIRQSIPGDAAPEKSVVRRPEQQARKRILRGFAQATEPTCACDEHDAPFVAGGGIVQAVGKRD